MKYSIETVAGSNRSTVASERNIKAKSRRARRVVEVIIAPEPRIGVTGRRRGRTRVITTCLVCAPLREIGNERKI
jgi:hypothetical protein